MSVFKGIFLHWKVLSPYSVLSIRHRKVVCSSNFGEILQLFLYSGNPPLMDFKSSYLFCCNFM